MPNSRVLARGPCALALVAVLAAMLVVGLPTALAQPVPMSMPVPLGIANLSATAMLEAPRDLMSVTLSTTRDGTDAGAVQAQLKQALDAALVEARKAARPGQLEVQTGNFALYPRYAGKGGINGWQGSAELVIEGRDMPAIGQLVGRIATLTVARVGYGLSREVRERVEADAAAQAIARFRARAADYAKQLGYAGFTIREVSVNTSENAPIRPQAMAMKSMTASSDEALPVEAGKASVVVGVSGSIQMK